MGIDAEMFARHKGNLSEKEVKHLAYRLAEAFGSDRFWIWKERVFKGDKPRHCLSVIDVYEQDGPEIYPEDGEQFIQVFPKTSYWGEGYERGDLPFIIAIAQWLEINIPECEIWYGGDSSGVCAELFDSKKRSELFAIFAKRGHEPYRENWGMLGKGQKEYCEFCDHEMNQYGFGNNYASFICDGCGEKRTYRNGKLVEED